MKIIECPRDAMQGIEKFIKTEDKISYINDLLKVGFHTIDFGSFVSPKAIPQMKDTHDVIKGIKKGDSTSKLLAIIANQRGAEDALKYDLIDYIGFPFSLSEQFQQRNTNKSIHDAYLLIKDLVNLCGEDKLVVYFSMAFGNPYGDKWNADIVFKYADLIADLGIKTISLADTVSTALPIDIYKVFDKMNLHFSETEFGAHFHSTDETYYIKLQAAYDGGCERFDSALLGYGGCPFAEDELVGNVDTMKLIDFIEEKDIDPHINKKALETAIKSATRIFTETA